MQHSIIITHRDRAWHLAQCLRSISRAARTMRTLDYEVLIVQPDGSPCVCTEPFGSARCRDVLDCRKPMDVFNKPQLQNVGVECALGEILTFLDCDVLVGPRWMEGIRDLDDKSLIRLCYRVRRLKEEHRWALDATDDAVKLVHEWFADYDSFDLGFEGYGEPQVPIQETAKREPIFGNSQFSIRRELLEELGDLRYNEDYVGAGFEDFWFIREIWRRDKDGYKAKILTDADHGLLHIEHPQASNWREMKYNKANFQRYKNS